jgi:hypothetical protein
VSMFRQALRSASDADFLRSGRIHYRLRYPPVVYMSCGTGGSCGQGG